MDTLQHQIEESNGRREFFYKAFMALSYNRIAGDYAEFGCYGGNTFRLAFLESRGFGYNCHMWAFDSFEGLPPAVDSRDEHPRWVPGHMATSVDNFHRLAKRFAIPANTYTVVPGFYENSLSDTAAGPLPRDISLAYIDCDLYSSTMEVLNFLGKRMKHGMIVALDDYYCFSNNQISGERAALSDFADNQTDFHFLPYAQYGWHGMSFIVESRVGREDKIPPGVSF